MTSDLRALPIVVALALSGVWGCATESPEPSHPALRAELGIDADTPIHDILLSGRGDRTRVLPAHLTVRPGDIVQFEAVDGRVHRVRFDLEGAAPEARAFLERTAQASPAPLVERNGRLVLTFDGAPAGEYPYVVEGFGEGVPGTIRVQEP